MSRVLGPRLNTRKKNQHFAEREDKDTEVEVHWPKAASRMTRRREAIKALPEEVIRLDVDWREARHPDVDWPSITIPRGLWDNLVLMAMKASK